MSLSFQVFVSSWSYDIHSQPPLNRYVLQFNYKTEIDHETLHKSIHNNTLKVVQLAQCGTRLGMMEA